MMFGKARGGVHLREIYEGSYESHMEGHSLARQALLVGCFLPTLKKDVIRLVKACESCKRHHNWQTCYELMKSAIVV